MVSTPTRHSGRKPAARQPSSSSRDTSGVRSGTSARTRSASPTVATAVRPPRKGILGAFARAWLFLEGSERQTNGSSYYMILGATLALTAIGLMMVLSASSVESIANAASTVEPTDEGAIVFDFFFKQSVYAVLGIVLMLILSRFGPRIFRFLAWPGLGIAIVLLVLVLLIGENINGNQNWIRIGNQSLQPSEPAKLALALWCATVLERKRGLIRNWKHALVPVAPLGGIILLLVMLGGDLGTAIILGMIMAAALFFAGAPMKMFTIAGILGIAGAFGAVLLNSTRSTRIEAWLRLNCDTASDPCFQSNQGLFALASGGWWGVGIGQSRQKWNWIPEAHNDFIFAIIGEEFGLIGTLVVIALFGILAVATLRVARRYTDPFVRILMGSILVWLIGQAFVNIGMVTGVLPVIGVPLPFISYGGSALTFTLAAVGRERRPVCDNRRIRLLLPHMKDQENPLTEPAALSVVLAGGGTAGHISPLLAIAQALVSARPDARVLAVGTAAGMETRLVPAAGFRLETIERVPMPRRPGVDLLKLPVRLVRAVQQALRIVDAAKADVVVGVGGYVSTPLYLAARIRRVPVVIHEANARPGLANRLGARIAHTVAVAFRGTGLPGEKWVGMPMRKEISTLDRAAARAVARTELGLDPALPTLIVTGGSSGAASINRAVSVAAQRLTGADEPVQVLHITGRGKQVTGSDGALLATENYRQVEYVDGMEKVYAAADLLLARAGAATVSEVAAVGLPTIFVPLPHGNGEQRRNAAEVVAAGGALLVEDRHLSADWLVSEALPLVQDAERLERMSRAAEPLGVRNADERMAKLIIDAAGGRS